MKISHGFLALTLAGTLTSGCTTKKYYTNGDGGTPGEASVSNVTPSTAFLGRTLDVTLSGSGTSWSASTKVDFGAGITVNSVNVASASALVANITIANSAAAGKRDVTVTDGSASEPYKMTFDVEPSVSVTVQGTQKQGSVLIVTIKNNDTAHFFDTTTAGDGFTTPITYPNINIASPAGTSVLIDNVTLFEIDAEVDVDVMATTGAVDLDVASGAADAVEHFVYPAAFTIAAQTATELVSNQNISLPDPYSSQLFTVTPAGANHKITLNAIASGNGQPVIALLDNTGEWANLIDFNSPVTFFSADTTPLYAIVVDASGQGGNTDSVQITDLAYTLATEGSDTTNNTKAGAVAITPPTLVQGASLSSAADQDWYKVTVAANQAINAVTQAGDAATDTSITVYAADGTTVVATGTENQSDYFDTVVTDQLTAGTYYIVVTAGTSYDSSATHYELDVSFQ